MTNTLVNTNNSCCNITFVVRMMNCFCGWTIKMLSFIPWYLRYILQYGSKSSKMSQAERNLVGTVVRGCHHNKYRTRREQDLYICRKEHEFRLYWMKLYSCDIFYTTAPLKFIDNISEKFLLIAKFKAPLMVVCYIKVREKQ